MRKPWTLSEKAKAGEMWSSGASCREIASALGRTYGSVDGYVDRYIKGKPDSVRRVVTPAPLPVLFPDLVGRKHMAINPVLAERIIIRVCQHWRITREQLFSRTHRRRLSWARFEAIWQMHQIGYSFLPLGVYFERDHSSCVHAAQRHQARVDEHEAERRLAA